MTRQELSIFDKQMSQFFADDDTKLFAANCYGVEWGQNPLRPKIGQLLTLLHDIAPYIHDIATGFLEPKTQAVGYGEAEVKELKTRLFEAIKLLENEQQSAN